MDKNKLDLRPWSPVVDSPHFPLFWLTQEPRQISKRRPKWKKKENKEKTKTPQLMAPRLTPNTKISLIWGLEPCGICQNTGPRRSQSKGEGRTHTPPPINAARSSSSRSCRSKAAHSSVGVISTPPPSFAGGGTEPEPPALEPFEAGAGEPAL